MADLIERLRREDANRMDMLRERAEAADMIERLSSALTGCQKVLDMLVDPGAIQATTPSHAWAQAVDAEQKARLAIQALRDK